MKSIVISNSRDTCLGLALAGIESIYAKDAAAIEKAFKTAYHHPDTGIIFLTERTFNLIEETVMSCKKKRFIPLITIIPDRHGYQDPEQKGIISRYIRESVGLS